MIIYKATNIVNGKCYIGQTTKTLNERQIEHLRKSKVLYNINYFYKAIRKYGFENFKWEILKDNIDDISILNIMETFMIMVHKSYINENGYNMNFGGGQNFGYKHTDEAKEKIGKSHIGKIPWNKGKTDVYSEKTLKQKSLSSLGKKHSLETKERLRQIRLGYKHTDEAKEKIRISSLNRKHTNETKKKISENHLGKNNPQWGKPLTNEHKEKISIKLKDRVMSEETRRKISIAKMGSKLSEETKKNLLMRGN